MSELFDLSGAAVGLTGGGGHLGAALARGLAAHGARVMILGRTPERLDAVVQAAAGDASPGEVFARACDVTEPEQVERALDALETRAGPPAGWVNNAYWGEAEPLGALSPDAVSRTLRGALGDAMLATDRVAARMREGGSIVNVASMYGIVSPQPGLYAEHARFHNPPAYGAAKAGLIQFTRYAAVHLAPRGIRVNALSPGAFPSEQVQQAGSFVDRLEERVPLGRIGEPRELVGALVFLLSAASSYVTGHNLVVDGGWTAQ